MPSPLTRCRRYGDSCTQPSAAVRPAASDVLHLRVADHPLSEYVEVKLAMLASAERALLLVDHSKFGKTATHAYGTVTDYDAVITDTGVPETEIASLKSLGVPVEPVGPGDHPQ